MGRQLTEAEVVWRLNELGFDLVGDYVGTTKGRQGLKDRACGHEWTTVLSAVFRENGSRCPKCSMAEVGRKRATTLECVLKRLDVLGFDLVGEYVGNTNDPQSLKDRVCGHEWKTSLSNVFNNGTRCPKCSGGVSLTMDEVNKRLDELGFELVGEYVGTTQTPQGLKDRACGHEWTTVLGAVFRENGTRCPKCSGVAPVTLDEANKRLDELGFDLVGEYVGTTKKPQHLKHRVCGYEWQARLSNVFQGTGCPKCSGVAPVTVDEVNKRLDELGFDLVGEYVGATTKPQGLKDRACGHEWQTTLNHVFKKNGSRCPKCSGVARWTKEKVAERLDALGFDLVGEYEGTTHKPQALKHRTCGHEWKARLTLVFNSGSGCPKCSGGVPLTIDEVNKRLDELGFELVGEYGGTTTKPQSLKDRVCGHEWKTALYHVFRRNGTKCPHCFREPWFKQGVYHLQHPDIPYAYIGISRKPTSRLDQHREDLGERGALARTIDTPKELTFREVRDVFDHGTDAPASVRYWFNNNADGDLPKGRWWFHSWSEKTMNKPARVPKFVAEWVETALIEQWSLAFPSPNPFVQAGKVRLVNIAKNKAKDSTITVREDA
jgi:predicted Zn-ribbon and HTH transcriptional regulator